MSEPADDSPPARPPRIFIYLLGLIVVLVGGYQLGQVGHSHPGAASGGGAAGHTHAPAPGADVGGLSLSGSGYTLALSPASSGQLRFRVLGPDGAPVREYATMHERKLHLIVARRDLSGYRHLHPTLAADGVWSTPLELPEPGVWRAVADFTALRSDGVHVPLALGIDLTANGEYVPHPLPAPVRDVFVADLSVVYEGTPQPGASVPLTFRAFRGGAPVTLEPYLGASGHLVLLREGDLGYVHVHPDAAAGRFFVALPSPGRYRMFFDFQVAGVVHTAAFTVVAG